MIPTRILAALVAAAAALAVLPAAAGALAALPSVQTYYLQENRAWTGKCLDNYRGTLAGGNALQIYNCQNSVNQKITRLSDGHAVVQNGQTDANGYQYCMDYYPTNGSVGSQVKIWPCRPLTGPGDSQHWYYLGSNQWMGGSGNCISAQAGTNETRITMAECNAGAPPANTRWWSR